MRDGVTLSAIAYLPREPAAPAPCVFTLTPYVAATYHAPGVYFASHGQPFLSVDVRGRGNSGGTFTPLLQEARDGHDVVEWLARQPYCNGKVAMWGGSYAGYDQWATAKERPPHLATIVPAASGHPGVDFPARNNIRAPYILQWLAMTAGHTSQAAIYGDDAYWAALSRDRYKAGAALDTVGDALGQAAPATLRDWLAHPEVDAYFDAFNPTCAEFAAMDIPILTITGSYDADQAGAMAFYQDFMRCASSAERARHYLVIGPWDHEGTRIPAPEVGGVKLGPASMVDLLQLHSDWYGWTMAGRPRPTFLKKPVAYYVMGAETWRFADTLAAVTARSAPFFLASRGDATSIFASGAMAEGAAGAGAPDSYVYDPRDVATADLQAQVDPYNLVDQRLVLAGDGKQLVYHSPPFATDTELSGFFKLSAWLAIDQPDTDFTVSIYEIEASGRSILLTNDILRARYREGLRRAAPVTTRAPLRYDFDHFTFVSRRVAKGSRLRLVIAPINSIYSEKNYNTGGVVAHESMRDARPVTVRLFHDRDHPSALFVPYGQPE
ncbi:MAG TPA: CocE/NonD family hydrolase [Phenylobacterium sp.]|nr:CocE/NonD family hydrolase [Phenylobacterium sp.]